MDSVVLALDRLVHSPQLWAASADLLRMLASLLFTVVGVLAIWRDRLPRHSAEWRVALAAAGVGVLAMLCSLLAYLTKGTVS